MIDPSYTLSMNANTPEYVITLGDGIKECLSYIHRCYSYIGKVNMIPQVINLRATCLLEVSNTSGFLFVLYHMLEKGCNVTENA